MVINSTINASIDAWVSDIDEVLELVISSTVSGPMAVYSKSWVC